MNKKKVLYFMPDNPIAGKAGNLTRAKFMLDFFEENNEKLQVDFFSVSDWGIWNKDNARNFNKVYPNIKLHLYDRKIPTSKPFRRLFGYKIPNFFHKLFRGVSVDISGIMLKNNMRKLINRNKYDYAIISYAVWGSLVENLRHKPYLIIDTHDFITAQKSDKKTQIGKMFKSEMKILNKFDEIWTYSIEEEYIFGQFTDKKVTLIPLSFPLNFRKINYEKKFDVIYVASENPHNIKGFTWFLQEVLPFLNGINIHVIGKICAVTGEYDNIIKHGVVDDLNDFYNHSAIAICPMLSGTGIKIKILEALSYGIPVVTNRRGVDGLVNKKNNGCLVTDNPKIFAENIVRLLNDQVFYNHVKDDAISYFKQNHDLKFETEILNNIFK